MIKSWILKSVWKLPNELIHSHKFSKSKRTLRKIDLGSSKVLTMNKRDECFGKFVIAKKCRVALSLLLQSNSDTVTLFNCLWDKNLISSGFFFSVLSTLSRRMFCGFFPSLLNLCII